MSNYIKVLPAVSTPIGATLMKTGQTTSYRTGDDGDLEVGRATDFFTLPSNNPFGNTNRFTSELGTQTYTNNIVIDWSTYNGTNVLGYYKTFHTITGGSWNSMIDWCLALSHGGFTSGWRMANENEVKNIKLPSTAGFFNYSPFNIPNVFFYHTSSTDPLLTTSAIYQNWNSYNFLSFPKTQDAGIKPIPVRTFTVTGTTLT
jgi:hypothetical protein